MKSPDISWMLETMLRIRRFEERVRDLFADAEIPGFVHLYIGEEAIAVGACAALSSGDYITSTHRGHGHCIAKGLDVKRMMAELYGKATGYCKGKGGSMHIADFDSGMLGANGIVGAGASIAVGAALSSVLLKNGRVALCFFGDGALAQGPWHEAVNLAAVWRLPVIFICENNQYAEMTPVQDQHRLETLAGCTAAYGIPGARVNGMEVFEVYHETQKAVDRAREGKGPTFIECLSYRFRGHFEGDPGSYRSREEVEAAWKQDPVEVLKRRLIETQTLSKEEIERVDQRIKTEIDSATEFARNSLDPDSSDAYTDIFSEEIR